MDAKVTKLAQRICFLASEKKAKDIVILDMENISNVTDSFVICSGNSVIQVRAIVDFIEEQMPLHGYNLLHKEGYKNAEWVLLDYGDCVLHVFIDEARSYYALERLFSNAKEIRYEENHDV